MLKKLRISKDYKNILTLMSGTTISQVIPIIATIFIARLYSGYEFGEIELFLKLSSFLVVISTLRYELAIPLPKLDKHAFYLFHFSLRWNLIFMVLTQVLLVLAFYFLNPFLGEYEFSNLYLFLPVYVFLMAFSSQAENWFLRKELFKQLSYAKVANAFGNNVLKIGLGLLSVGSIGLIFGNIIGFIIGGLFFLPETLRAFSRNERTETTKKARWVSAKSFRDFPFVNAPHAIIEAVKEILVVVLFTLYYGIEIVGFYYFALKIIRIPISLIGIAFAQVFYKNAADLISEKKSIKKYVLKNARDLFLISIVPTIVLLLFGDKLFEIAFGSEWVFAGKLAQINAPVLLIIFISSPLSRLPMLLNQQRWFFLISMINNVFVLGAILVGFNLLKFGFENLWILLTVVQVLVLGSVVLWYYSIVKQYEKKLKAKA